MFTKLWFWLAVVSAIMCGSLFGIATVSENHGLGNGGYWIAPAIVLGVICLFCLGKMDARYNKHSLFETEIPDIYPSGNSE